MKNKVENPPAFPCVHDRHLQEGMSLRDYFAAKVLEGTMSNPEATEYLSKSYGEDLDTAFERISNKAYKLADAMLNQRTK